MLAMFGSTKCMLLHCAPAAFCTMSQLRTDITIATVIPVVHVVCHHTCYPGSSEKSVKVEQMIGKYHDQWQLADTHLVPVSMGDVTHAN